MKLRLTPRATQDLVTIADYVRERDPQAAIRVRAAIRDGLKTLTTFPNAGRPQDIPPVRKLVTHKYSYLIYYAIDEEAGEIHVLTIQHPARARDSEDQ